MATESARFRCPLTSPVFTAAPAITIEIAALPAPWSGSSTIRSFSTTSEMPALWTSTSGAAASTDTVSSRFADGRAPALMRRRGANLQHDAGLRVGPESLKRHFDPIRPEREVRKNVRACLVGHDGAGESGISLRDGDGHARQDCAAVVADRSAELCGRLRPCGAGEEEDKRADGEAAEQAVHDEPPSEWLVAGGLQASGVAGGRRGFRRPEGPPSYHLPR